MKMGVQNCPVCGDNIVMLYYVFLCGDSIIQEQPESSSVIYNTLLELYLHREPEDTEVRIPIER